MTVVLSDAARQFLALFEDVTGATGRDCVVDDAEESSADQPSGERPRGDGDRVIIVVKPGDMGKAIGPGGANVRRLEEKLGKDVTLVEDADSPDEFVKNALAPAVVHHVTISENDTTVAYAEVSREDTGVAIGKDGQNISAAKLLAERHFDIDDIQLT